MQGAAILLSLGCIIESFASRSVPRWDFSSKKNRFQIQQLLVDGSQPFVVTNIDIPEELDSLLAREGCRLPYTHISKYQLQCLPVFKLMLMLTSFPEFAHFDADAPWASLFTSPDYKTSSWLTPSMVSFPESHCKTMFHRPKVLHADKGFQYWSGALSTCPALDHQLNPILDPFPASRTEIARKLWISSAGVAPSEHYDTFFNFFGLCFALHLLCLGLVSCEQFKSRVPNHLASQRPHSCRLPVCILLCILHIASSKKTLL